jgi:hypothetical protein
VALNKKQASIVAEITKKYGQTIDLKKSPGVLIEILRNYGATIREDGEGGVSPSTIAVGITPPPPPPPAPSGDPGDVRLADVMKALLNVQRDIQAIKANVAAQKATKAQR